MKKKTHLQLILVLENHIIATDVMNLAIIVIINLLKNHTQQQIVKNVIMIIIISILKEMKEHVLVMKLNLIGSGSLEELYI